MTTNVKKIKAHLIEVMAIINLPPCNLNSDESGRPKEGKFGDFIRARLSSQSLKYALRYSKAFEKFADCVAKSIRSARIYEYIYQYIGEDSLSPEMKAVIKKLVLTFSSKLVSGKVTYDKANDTYIFPEKINKTQITVEDEGSEGKTKQDKQKGMTLVYSKEQLNYILETVAKMVKLCDGDASMFALFTNKNVFERSQFDNMRPVALDTACFGTMSANDALSSIPAAVRVAQTIGTNIITRESDYYIAGDDFVRENPDKAQGAGNIGYIDFVSPCFFKYVSIDLDILRNNLCTVENLDEIFNAFVCNLIKEFAEVLPEGKQASNAAYTKPALVCVTVKEKKVPCSYANAFETPVHATLTESLSKKSIDAFVKEVDAIDKCYEPEILERGWLSYNSDNAPKNATVFENVSSMLDMVESYL